MARRALSLCAGMALLLTALPAPASAAAEERIGAFFTLVNAYIYPVIGRENSRILVRPNSAYAVVDLFVDEQDRLWYQIVYPDRSKTDEGFGWTPLTPQQLLAAESGTVSVFPEPLAAAEPPGEVLQVPAANLEMLNETQGTEAFPQMDWQKVRYRLDQPLPAWIRAPTGIYRPGRDVAYMERSHEALTAQNVEEAKWRRLMSGVVQLGDTTQEVTWALGTPGRVQEESPNGAARTVWVYPNLEAHFENDVVIQLDTGEGEDPSNP